MICFKIEQMRQRVIQFEMRLMQFYSVKTDFNGGPSVYNSLSLFSLFDNSSFPFLLYYQNYKKKINKKVEPMPSDE